MSLNRERAWTSLAVGRPSAPLLHEPVFASQGVAVRRRTCRKRLTLKVTSVQWTPIDAGELAYSIPCLEMELIRIWTCRKLVLRDPRTFSDVLGSPD